MINGNKEPHLVCTSVCDWSNVDFDYLIKHLAENKNRHWINLEMVKEVLSDPFTTYYAPVWASNSGQASQTVGYSPTYRECLTVVVLHSYKGLFALTAYETKGKKLRKYLENKEKELGK